MALSLLGWCRQARLATRASTPPGNAAPGWSVSIRSRLRSRHTVARRLPPQILLHGPLAHARGSPFASSSGLVPCRREAPPVSSPTRGTRAVRLRDDADHLRNAAAFGTFSLSGKRLEGGATPCPAPRFAPGTGRAVSCHVVRKDSVRLLFSIVRVAYRLFRGGVSIV